MKLQRQPKCPVLNKKIGVCSVCLVTMLRDGMLEEFVCTCLTIYSFVNRFPSTCSTRDHPCPVRDGYPGLLQRIASPT